MSKQKPIVTDTYDFLTLIEKGYALSYASYARKIVCVGVNYNSVF